MSVVPPVQKNNRTKKLTTAMKNSEGSCVGQVRILDDRILWTGPDEKNETGGEDARHPHPPVCRFEGPSLPRG